MLYNTNKKGVLPIFAGLLAVLTVAVFGLTGSPAHAQGKDAKNTSSWFKLCFKENIIVKKGDKPTQKDVCLTQYESFNPKNGRVLVAAAVRQIEGLPNKQFMVIVPHGMFLPAGVRVQIDKNKTIALPYTLCTPGGCTAELPVDDALLKQLKSGKTMRIAAVLTRIQKPVYFPVPLNGFEVAMNGKAIDNKKYAELIKKLLDKIRERNQKVAQQKK